MGVNLNDSSYITVGLAIILVVGLLGLLRYGIGELAQERLWRGEADRDLRDYIDAAVGELRSALEKVSNDNSTRNTLIYQEFLKTLRDRAEKYAPNALVARS